MNNPSWTDSDATGSNPADAVDAANAVDAVHNDQAVPDDQDVNALAEHMPDFTPNPLVRAALIQTVISARLPGKLLREPRVDQPVIVDAGPDETGYADRVRLLAYVTMQTATETSNGTSNGTSDEASDQTSNETSRGLVVVLHGWEGSSDAAFSLILMSHLLEAGYDVVRLNLRDHGPRYHVEPHALNPGIFLGTLLAESHQAVQTVAAWSRGKPVYVVGPSMGGNFVLRMAVRHATHPIPNLRRVIAVSPALDPGDAIDQIDSHWYLQAYFRPRWLRSLRTKQSLFPHLYTFDDMLGERSLRRITERLVKRYTHYADADDYFSRYTVTAQDIAHIAVPTTVLSAADDPVCRPTTMEAWPQQPHLKPVLLPYGGHVGFVDIWPIQHRLPDFILAELT